MYPSVLKALLMRGDTLATAESLTGGLLATRISDVPGASQAFRGGVVAYSSDVKTSVLGVPADVVSEHGVVSAECARAMAEGVRSVIGADWGLATTGVAGPDRQEDKPVGTVWIAVAGPSGVTSRLLALEGDRHEIREATCVEVTALLDRLLRGDETTLG